MDKKFREYLLKQVIKLERQLLVVIDKEVDWDEIPPDVCAEVLKLDKSQAEIDVTKSREREMMEMFA